MSRALPRPEARPVPLVPEPTEALPAPGSAEGLLSWVGSVDHKQIGLLYLCVTFFFLLVGGVEALVMRLQLSGPNNHVVSPQVYNQLFTMHGTTMVFLVVMPMLIGVATYLVPLMIGARDMAFPRLNALSLWLLVFGGLLLYYSFLAGGAPDFGWYGDAPLTEKGYSPNPGADYWAMGLIATGIGTIASGINLIVTIATLRAPGLTIRRLPLFVWMVLINSFLIIWALPSLNASLALIFIDRQLTAHFFDTTHGGAALLWQHYFWSFGHPEVYIMVLPAFGIISEVIPVFSRRPIYGYAFVAASTLAIGFLSFAVWGHHMFAAGMGQTLNAVFSFGSMAIAVPTGIKIFNWLATMIGGAIRFSTSMLFAMGFLAMFTIGGLSGVSFAIVPIDWQVTASYYVVAHMHYVLFGGTLFAVFSGAYYWFPKFSGRLLSEALGKIHFWTMLVGFNLAFFPQHILGIMGMARRIWTYPDLPDWHTLNLISSVGAFVLALAILVFVANVLITLRWGKPAGDNPWRAWTLEWATSSPPPIHNFELLPPIRSRRPLWDLAHPENPDWKHAPARPGSVPTVRLPGAPADRTRLAVALFLSSELVFFALLIFAYLFYRNAPSNVGGAHAAHNALDVGRSAIFTACLLASSLTVWLAGRSRRAGDRRGLLAWLGATIALGVIFLAGQLSEYLRLIDRQVTVSRDVFGSAFYTLTGFHGLHVFAGLVALCLLLGLALAGDGRGPRWAGFSGISLYWHFVDAVWLLIFSIIYIGALVG